MNKHAPTLNTVLMVEEFIKKHSQEYTKYQLWKRLPKKIMYQTYLTILRYLEDSNKILIHGGIVMWIYDPETVNRLIKKGLVVKDEDL